MIPDEMYVYEPHHVGYARFGTSWYRVIANYGGGDLVLAPQTATQDEVDHKFCKTGCRRVRYVRKANWLLRQPEFTVEEQLPPTAPVPLTSRTAMSLGVTLALILGFGVGVATTVYFISTPPPLLAETSTQVPAQGTLYRHEKSWWRVEEVFAQDVLARDQKAAGKYQAHLKAGKLVVPFNYTPSEESQEQTVFLVLNPAHPPLGMMMSKGMDGSPNPSLGIPQPIQGQAKQQGPLGPPKGQWK